MVPTVAIKNIYSLLDDIRSAGSSIVKATGVVLATASKAGCDVGLDECGPREPALGFAACDPDDLLHLRLAGERFEDAGSEVARGTCDDDAHGPSATRS